MAFASTRSSADSRFILGGLLLTLALAVLGSESACAAAQPSVSADYAANVPAPGEVPSEERAAALWKNFADAEALDYRVDLLALQFGPAVSRLPGAAAVTGISAEPALLAKFFAAAARQGVSFESAVDQVPEPKSLDLMTWGIVKVGSAELMDLDPKTAGRTERTVRIVVLGERVRILKRTSATASEAPGWALVQCLDGRLGWISESWLALKNDMAFVSWNRQNAAVMRRPNTELCPENGDALVFAGAGIQLYQLEHQPDYWEVLLPDGRKAKVSGTALEDVSAWQQREEELRRSSPSAYLKALAASAEGLVGSKAEVLGAPLPVVVLRMHDLLAPGDIDRLARLGAPLSGGRDGAELKAGDLVFFGEHDEPQSAGIWLGEGRFAAVDPQTDRVAVLKLSDLRQNAKKTKTLGAFLWAVRLKPQELQNPCLLSSRSHPFFQTPPAELKRCQQR